MRKEKQYLRNKKEENIMKNKKKKGFTLIELIAVIAILGILAAVLVPNITRYTDSAKIRRAQADSKVIINAIQLYNAENGTSATTYNSSTMSNLLGTTPDPTLAALTVTELERVSRGKKATLNAGVEVDLDAATAATYTDGN